MLFLSMLSARLSMLFTAWDSRFEKLSRRECAFNLILVSVELFIFHPHYDFKTLLLKALHFY